MARARSWFSSRQANSADRSPVAAPPLFTSNLAPCLLCIGWAVGTETGAGVGVGVGIGVGVEGDGDGDGRDALMPVENMLSCAGSVDSASSVKIAPVATVRD